MATCTRPELWEHQRRGIKETIAAFEAGEDRVCLTGPTGSGKSRQAAELMEWALNRGQASVFYTNRRLLLEQMCRFFDALGIEYGVRAAGFEDLYKPHEPIQIASTQTEHARAYQRSLWKPHEAQLVIFDELHLQKGGMAGDIMARHEDEHSSRFVGLTATPLGVHERFPRLVVAGKVSECRQVGALVPCHVYGPTEFDMRHVERTGPEGEYSLEDVRKRWTTKIFGHVLEHWKRLNPEQRPTVLFAPGVAESVWFAEQFEAAGVSAAHIDGADLYVDRERSKTDREGRERILARVREGDIKVICNRFVCLDSETEILTTDGWVGMEEMTPEHKVANWDSGKIWYAKPKRIVRRKRESGERMVSLGTPRRSIRVTENHELLYRRSKAELFRKHEAGHLVGTGVAHFQLPSLTEVESYAMTKYRLAFEESWKDEEVWCVETESGNIITRRHGTITIMGNCREGIDLLELYCAILATPIGSLVSYLQAVGRVLRSHPSMDHVVLIDHGGNWHRHGSPNLDRDWAEVFTLQPRVITDLRLERIRERTVNPSTGKLAEPEPRACPMCGRIRNQGPKCVNPECGYMSSLRTRRVLQADGQLVDLTGDIYKPRHTRLKPTTQSVWEGCYWRCRNSNRTFGQAYGLFYYENGYCPPRDLKLMPMKDLDWYRKVDQVGTEHLR